MAEATTNEAEHNDDRLTNRPSYSEKKISETYSFNTIKTGDLWLKTRNYLRKYYTPSKDCWKRYLVARLPIIKWMRNYSVRDNLLKDTIGGLTIGVVQIPQSMGYALMAGVPPVTGLYVSFFTVIIYFFLGTCRNLSLGTYGIVSLMVNSALEKFEGKLYPSDDINASFVKNSTGANALLLKTTMSSSDVHQVANAGTYLSDNPDEAKIMIATSIAFFVGIFQLALGLIHAGVVTKYLSDIIVAGFTTGAAYHIVISQLNSLVGISVKHEYSLFKITEYFIELFGNISKINWPTVIVSVVSMFELYMVKHFINQRYKDRMIAPFPIELVIVAFGTLFSYLFRFHENFKIAIVGTIPVGIPAPRMPPLWLFSQIVFESIEIAIVSFALNISMAKLFAKRYNYQIRPNQELFAYGLGNFVSCFFQGFPSCVGLSRSVILESTGAKTLLNSAISCVVVLVVIVAIGFIFKTLPIACLSAIIVIALIPMLSEVRQIVTIFKRSKVEALAWLATFLGVIILDVDFGLYIGIVFSLLLFIIQNQRARTYVMGNIPETDIYEAIDECDDAREIDGIKIIRYESSIFYANVENFTYNIIKLARVNPIEINEKIAKRRAEYMKKVNRLNGTQCSKKSILKLIKRKDKNTNNSETSKTPNIHDLSNSDELRHAEEELNAEIAHILHSVKIKDLIIDFSCVNLIDSMGVEAIENLIENYEKLGIQVHLSYCKRYVIRIFNKSKMKEKINSDFIYPTTHDSVLRILKSQEAAKAVKAAAAAAITGARLEGTPATISATSMTTSSAEAPSSSFSIEIDKDKYEKLEGDDAPSHKVYLKKQDDYDIINEIVSAI